MKTKSLQARLIIGAIGWIALGLSMASISISGNLSEHIMEWMDAELSDHLTELMGLVKLDEQGNFVLQQSLSDPRFNQIGSKFYWQVTNEEGPVLKSHSLGDKELPLPDKTENITINHRTLKNGPAGPVMELVNSRTETNGQIVQFQIGVDKSFVDKIMSHFRRAMNTSFAILGLVLAAAAMLQIKFGLRPLAQLRSELAKIKTGKINNLSQTFPNEVQPLVHDLNSMINANAQIVQKARLQAGNLAHGLKTSLAILNDEADRLEIRGQTETSQIILQQCQAMERHINYQLARARAAAMCAVPGIATDVQSALSAIISALNRLYPDLNLRMMSPVPTRRTVSCDPLDFNEMVGNLLENSCKWANNTVTIDHYTNHDDGKFHILIDDDGPGLLPEQINVVFQAGKKLDERMTGSGLGLPIVRDLVEQYGGSIVLSRASIGGLRADLAIPAPHVSDHANTTTP